MEGWGREVCLPLYIPSRADQNDKSSVSGTTRDNLQLYSTCTLSHRQLLKTVSSYCGEISSIIGTLTFTIKAFIRQNATYMYVSHDPQTIIQIVQTVSVQ